MEDLLQVGGKQILPVIPLIIAPLKRALNTRDEQVNPHAYYRIRLIVPALVLCCRKIGFIELIGCAGDDYRTAADAEVGD